jgi:hypothetical protein
MTWSALSTGTLVNKLTTPKLAIISRDCTLMGFNNSMKWPEFFTKDCDLPTNGLSILCRNPARA